MSPQHLYPTATAQDLDATPVPQASGPPLVDTACSYWQAGLCPMPRVIGHVEPSYIDEQGEVRPIPWGQYKVKQPDWATVARWFAQSDLATVGMLLLTGSHAHPRADHTAFPQILDIETGTSLTRSRRTSSLPVMPTSCIAASSNARHLGAPMWVCAVAPLVTNRRLRWPSARATRKSLSSSCSISRAR